MKRALAFLALLSPAWAPAQAPEAASPPAVNWVLPIFTDKEGYRAMTLRGSEVRYIADGNIEVRDFNITIFSGDAAAKVDKILLSPQAIFYPKEKRAAGDKSVRVIVPDQFEAAGDRWSYDDAAKRVLIDGHVHVVFHVPLDAILK